MGEDWVNSGNVAGPSVTTGVMTFGRVRIDTRTGEVMRDHGTVKLTPKAARLLATLLDRAPELVTKNELLLKVWDGKAVGDDALTSCVQELRRALGDDARRPRFIETRHRRGYRWVIPFEPPADDSIGSSSSRVRLFGRDREIDELRRRFGQAQAGRRQFVLVTGEPGIGKTALVDGLVADVAAARQGTIAHGQCLDQHGVGEPYLPLIDALRRLASGPAGLAVRKILSAQAPGWLAQMPSLLNDVQRELVGRRTATRDRMLHELTVALEALSADTPLVLQLEDLHWSDASTLDWLGHVARRREPARLMIVGTMRPAEATEGRRRMSALLTELAVHDWCHELALPPLGPDAIREFLGLQLGNRLEPERLGHIVSHLRARTGGNPLFMVGLVHQLTQKDDAKLGSEAFADVPGNVRRLIRHQIENLREADCDLLMAASVIGRQFAPRLAAPVVGQPVEAVEKACARLANENAVIHASGVTTWPDSTRSDTYIFRHDLYREALYDRFAATARERAHLEVGRALEQAWAEQPDAIASELAEHFERGRDFGRAVPHLQRAAAKAQRRGANEQALEHLRRALDCTGYLAGEIDRTRREAELYVAVGAAHAATRGFGSAGVADALAQAELRCARLGESADLFPVMWGQWLFRWGRSDLAGCRGLAARMLNLAQHAGDSGLELQAHHAMWTTMFGLGHLERARAHVEAGLILYDRRRHGAMASSYGNHDACVCGRNFAAIARALAGEAEGARNVLHQALEAATELGDPFSLSMMHFSGAMTGQILGDVSLATDNAEKGWQIADEYGLGVQKLQHGGVLGWCRAVRGDRGEGLTLLRESIGGLKAAQSVSFVHYLMALLADAALAAGRLDEALNAAREGIAIAENTGECYFLAELYRLSGVLAFRLAAQPKMQAQADLERAIELAHQQGATLLEQKARASLGLS